MTPKTLKQAFAIACEKPKASESKTPPLRVDTYVGTPGEAMAWLKYGALAFLLLLAIPFVAAFYGDAMADHEREGLERLDRERAKEREKIEWKLTAPVRAAAAKDEADRAARIKAAADARAAK